MEQLSSLLHDYSILTCLSCLSQMVPGKSEHIYISACYSASCPLILCSPAGRETGSPRWGSPAPRPCSRGHSSPRPCQRTCRTEREREGEDAASCSRGWRPAPGRLNHLAQLPSVQRVCCAVPQEQWASLGETRESPAETGDACQSPGSPACELGYQTASGFTRAKRPSRVLSQRRSRRGGERAR